MKNKNVIYLTREAQSVGATEGKDSPNECPNYDIKQSDGKVLCFDLLTRPKMPFKVMHRKEVTHSNGSYERKSRGRKLAHEMGRAKKFPWYTHRLMHRKRVTCELHDSYFSAMTITQAIPKIAEVTHPDRQISEEIVEA